MENELKKCCSRCGIEKPIAGNFHKRAKSKDGFGCYCKPCANLIAIAWQKSNPEKKKLADRNRQQKLKRERIPVLCSCGCGLLTKGRAKGLPLFRGHGNRGRRHKPRSPGFPDGVILDELDRINLCQHSWSLSGNGYIQRHAEKIGGGWTKVRLHREILDFPDGLVDHINGNKLDCRRHNMRVTNHQGNAQNQSLSVKNTSGHRGVSWRAVIGKWYAYGKIDGRMIALGFYDDLQEAADVALKFRQENYSHFVDR